MRNVLGPVAIATDVDARKLIALQGLISGGKESKQHLNKKMADYTAASAKHLNPRPTRTWRRGEDAEKIHSDMIAAQVCRAA